MIGVLHATGKADAAGKLAEELRRRFPEVDVQCWASDDAPPTWPEPIAWDDVLVVLYASAEWPAQATAFVQTFSEQHGAQRDGERVSGGFVVPIAAPGASPEPPPPIGGLKSLPLGDPRIITRIQSMLGVTPNRRDQLIFVSYRSVDGEQIAHQIHADLVARGFAAWLDEANENLQVGDDLAEQLDAALRDATMLVLVDTPEAFKSRWVRLEVKRAHGQLIPILPVVIGDPRSTRFLELKDLHRDVLLREQARSTEELATDELAADELEKVRAACDDLMSDGYRRRNVIRNRAERAFVENGYSWDAVDQRRRMFASAKQRAPLPDHRVLSHCSIHDPDYERTARVVSEFEPGGPMNLRLLVYEYRLGPLTDYDIELLRESEAYHDLILAHHSELDVLVSSSFDRLR